jgi:hypothetical protein
MTAPLRPKRPAYQFTLLGLFGAVTVLAVALGVQSNLRQSALALHMYGDLFAHLPSGTKYHPNLKPEKRLSWMAELLPLIEQPAVRNGLNFAQSWDAPVNQPAASTRIDVWLNPQLGEPATVNGYGATHYVGIAGVGKDAAELPERHPRAGFFGYDRTLTLDELAAADGTSSTIAIVEVSKNIGPWAAGGESTVRALTRRPYINGPDGFGGVFPGGMNVVMGDASARFISDQVDPRVLERAATTHAGDVVHGPY